MDEAEDQLIMARLVKQQQPDWAMRLVAEARDKIALAKSWGS